MPFKSEAQKKWMQANKPEMAKEWEKETTASLPARVGKPKTKPRAKSKTNKLPPGGRHQ